MSEHSMSKLVMEAIHHLDPVRVENPAHPGTPDINYAGSVMVTGATEKHLLAWSQHAEGWIELKELDKWPARAKTVVRMEHFTNQQRIWLERRWRKGGAAWLLIKVERTWLLLTGEVGARIAGRVIRAELESASAQVWRDSATMKRELARCLSRRVG